MRKLIYFFLLTSIFIRINGQDSTFNSGEELGNLYERLAKNNNDSIKIRINDSIRVIIDNYVRSDSIFDHNFKNIRYLGQITSPDSLLKIVTWNLVLEDNNGMYFCYLIRRGELTGKKWIYNLQTPYRQESIKTDTIIIESEWYGALYYDLKPYFVNGRQCWVLLGLDYGNPEITRKIIDVLNFTPNSVVSFGSKWFLVEDNLRYRKVFEYASGGMMTLRFTSDTSIVFDHLVPFSPEMEGDRRYYGPDYSYDAYIYRNGIWNLSLNVDARNKE